MPEAAPADDTQEGERSSTKKKLKGKGKRKGKERMSQTATLGPQTDPVPSAGPSETEEDKAEREKANKPYSATSANDIDAIPVVHLDDLPPLSQVAETQFPSLLRDSASVIPSEPFVVDKNGEMPEGATSPPSSKPDPSPPMVTSSIDTAPQMLSSFPAYVVDEEIPRTKTPEPIKVKRTKKRGYRLQSQDGQS
ncbi:hypothetical protein BJV77DRAFT_1065737 [Russula vinacea]|nr:hypothetical protein BJV77DRAFT_1065737 [Russula vinacea]